MSVHEDEQGNQSPAINLTYVPENEYAMNIDASYMQALEDKFRADGMTVPFTFNDPWTGNHFANGEGSVDIYGWDGYPLGFDCSNPDVWPYNVSTYYRAYHEGVNPTEPMAIYEFQGKCRCILQLGVTVLFTTLSVSGGAFDPWQV